MGLIEDLRSAIDVYEKDNVETTIVNFTKPGTVLNKGETFRFSIKIHNQSHLDMKNVRVQAQGTTYADVGRLYPPDALGSTTVSLQFNLDAHQTRTVGGFFGKAKNLTNGAKDIVTARIYRWDASLDHLLTDHTGAGPKEGKLHTEIHAD